MTIGIVATGPNIAPEVVSALSGMEQLARGALGGFVALVVRTGDGKMHYFETQNGGVHSLSNQISILEDSRAIGLISSGPFRPEPLNRFLAWDEQGNIVSGHRFPQLPSRSGLPINLELLSLVQQFGIHPEKLDAIITENAELDAGFVVMDCNGNLYQRDTLKVGARKDTGSSQGFSGEKAIAVALNSISFPELVCDFLVRRVLEPDYLPVLLDKEVTIHSSSQGQDQIQIDPQRRVTSLYLTDSAFLKPHYEGALVYSGTPVYQGGELIGVTEDEPYVVCHSGKIKFLNGQACALLKVKHTLG